jgi:hypothetical protein
MLVHINIVGANLHFGFEAGIDHGIMSFELQITSYKLRITNYELRVGAKIQQNA